MNGKLNLKVYQIVLSKFKSHCHQGVVLGYKSMLSNPSEFKQWKEEKISARLLHEMKKISFFKSKNIVVGRESDLEDEEILFGEKEAAEADRIDFIFSSTWKQKEYLEYFGEAKNLSHKDWKKKTRKNVKAWNQRDYYFKTGINGLVSGKYNKLEGFLIGYVVNGSATNNVLELNKFLKARQLFPSIGFIENKKSICSYPECYSSKNIKDRKEIILHHIFLEFDS